MNMIMIWTNLLYKAKIFLTIPKATRLNFHLQAVSAPLV